MNEIKSLTEAQQQFPTDLKCREYLASKRWPNGAECPRCGRNHQHYMPRYRKWYCKHCDYQYSVLVNTVFHNSKLPLTKWFVAVWLLCYSPKGCSAKQLERIIGTCYETAWSMAHRIRQAMANDVNQLPLSGTIEIDAAVMKADGGKATGNVKYDAKDVLGVVQRGGVIRMFVLNHLRKAEIDHIVRKNLHEVEKVYTDMCGKLNFLKNLYPTETVNHWLSYVNGEAHVNNCENAFSLFKRGLMGHFHHVSAKWLQSYLDAFAFRYSHRYEKGVLFDRVLASS